MVVENLTTSLDCTNTGWCWESWESKADQERLYISFYVTGGTGWGHFFFQKSLHPCSDFDSIINQTNRVTDEVVLSIST